MGIFNKLKRWLKGYMLLAIVGVGNTLKGDDGVGVYIIRGLREKVKNNRIKLFEVGLGLENYLSIIKKTNPSHILFIDAGYVSSPQLISAKKISQREVLSTHTLSLKELAEYFNSKVAILCVPIEKTKWEEGLTNETEETKNIIVNELSRLLRKVILVEEKKSPKVYPSKQKI